jgi:hypothetical protein
METITQREIKAARKTARKKAKNHLKNIKKPERIDSE